MRKKDKMSPAQSINIHFMYYTFQQLLLNSELVLGGGYVLPFDLTGIASKFSANKPHFNRMLPVHCVTGGIDFSHEVLLAGHVALRPQRLP